MFIKRGRAYNIASIASEVGGGWWTNKDAEDFKISRCPTQNINEWKDFIPAKNGVLIGGLTF